MKKSFILFLTAAAFSLPSLASSTYVGSDTACFYGIFGHSCTLTSSQSDLGIKIGGQYPLSYTPDSSSFTAGPNGGVVQLGSFAVGNDVIGAQAGTFDLEVTFTAPAGSGGKTYTADTFGVVSFLGGFADITFNNPTTQLYTYPGGEFDLSVPSSTITIGEGCDYTLDATITPVPEPGFLAGFGSLLLLPALVRRRARQKKA